MDNRRKLQTTTSVIQQQWSEGLVTEIVSEWFRHRCFIFLRFCFFLMIVIDVFIVPNIYAQNSESRYFYAVELLETGEIIRRGTTTEDGIPFSGQLILASDTEYRYWLYEVDSGLNGFVRFTTAPPGQQSTIPDVPLGLSLRPDTDQDGLDDEAEFIIGTNALEDDTDGDGILDGAEIAQGLDPFGDLVAFTGVIAAVDSPGNAVDVAAFNDAVVIADGFSGISVFNVFNGMDPLIVAQVNTPGEALAVGLSVNDSGNFVTVADGPAGLAIIDITDPPSAQIIHQVNLPGNTQALSATSDRVFVGTADENRSAVHVVDVLTGQILDSLRFSSAIQDVFLAGDYLYVLRQGNLHVVDYLTGPLRIIGSAQSPGLINANNGRMRLFVGGGVAYAVHNRGYNTIDVSNPEQPQLINHPITPQFGWKQIVLNGSGLGLAAVSPNQAFDGPHHVSVYDVTDPAVSDAFITEFQTSGVARSVSIYNGLCYVADNLNGLQVINYQAFDALGIAPSIILETSANNNEAEEGKLFRVTAEVQDDVQVRNVEFYVDGVKVATDGNFPFEYRFITPLIENQLTFRLQARASDTGGNATFSDEQIITLTPDATPPRLMSRLPLRVAVSGDLSEVAAFFNEPMDAASFVPENFFVEAAGADGILDTSDDILLSGLSFTYREESNGAFLNQSSDFASGKYRVVVQNVTDLIGNALATLETWTFIVYDVGVDTDRDGVPDDLEALLGLDPDDSDSDNDGTPDGLEDFDSDGLVNSAEVILSLDPTNADTDGDGILDGNEDTDSDGLSDKDEFVQGTDPFLIDSDDDGFSDGDEFNNSSSPTDPQSLPIRFSVSPAFSVFNAIDPNIEIREAFGSSFSIFNSIDPDIEIREAFGSSFSIFNAIEPDIEIRQTFGPTFSVENQANP